MTQQEILDRVNYVCELRGLSAATTLGYWSAANRFQKFFGKPATELDVYDVQDYLHYMKIEKGNTAGTVNRENSGLRFVYNSVLEMPLDLFKIPCQRNYRRLPEIMTREEIAALVEACDNLRNRAMLMTCYGAGLRVSELVNLKVGDIDSANMQIYIRHGKGNKDRFALLSQVNLEVLREHWLKYRPRDYLFYSRNHRPITVRSAQDVFQKTRKLAGITKKVTIHTLRHCFATHLLEDGASIYHIKQLLGHAAISTTCIYLHLMKIRDLDVTSPLDKIYPGNCDV